MNHSVKTAFCVAIQPVCETVFSNSSNSITDHNEDTLFRKTTIDSPVVTMPSVMTTTGTSYSIPLASMTVLNNFKMRSQEALKQYIGEKTLKVPMEKLSKGSPPIPIQTEPLLEKITQNLREAYFKALKLHEEEEELNLKKN